MNNGPTFPTNGFEGMTRREYFAACALTGLLAAREVVDDAVSLAVAAADQLMTELNGSTP